VLGSIPAPQDQNFATLIIAIVLAIPVLLWVVIGHVLAPIYMQKIVMRGGGVVQGFAGTIFSVVGAGSMAAYSSMSGGWANGMRNGRPPSEDGHYPKRSGESFRRKRFEQVPSASDIFSSGDCFESGRRRSTGASVASGGREAGAGRFSRLGAGALDAGTNLMSRMGSAARFIGHAAAEGCGDGAGLDYRALAAFAPQSGNFRNPTSGANRSSLRARKYILEE